MPLFELVADGGKVSHQAELVAVQGHVAAEAVRITEAVFAADDIEAVAGETVYVHPLACDTVTVTPAIVSVAVRAGPLFAAMSSITVALPVPVSGDVTSIHETDSTTDHVHDELEVLIAMPDPDTADAPAVTVVGVTVYAHPVLC